MSRTDFPLLGIVVGILLDMRMVEPYPPEGPRMRQNPRSMPDQRRGQTSPRLAGQVVVGKLARALAGRYAVTSRPQGGGGLGERCN
ncbi:MAG: hypothetical protein ACYCPA_03550 [Acidithiobacillus sp.]